MFIISSCYNQKNMINKITILGYFLLVSITYCLYRRDLELTLKFSPQQMAVIDNQTLIVVDKNRLLKLNGSQFSQTHQLAMLPNLATSIYLAIIKEKPTFFSGESINQIIQQKQPLLNYSTPYVYTDLSGQMRLKGDKMLVPPINYQINSVFTIDLNKMEVFQNNYLPDKYGTVGSSNIFYDEDNAYFASVQMFIGAQIYRKIDNNVQFICNFPDGYSRVETSYSRDVALLDIKPYLGSKYLMLVWQSRRSYYHNINLAREVDGVYIPYSRIGMQGVVASYLTGKGTIITYEATYQQIEQIDPHNPMARNIVNQGIQNYVQIRDISQNQQYFFGAYAYSSSGFAQTAYIYKLNAQQVFQKQIQIIKNGSGFGSGIFVGEDQYIAILEQGLDNIMQISFFSIVKNNFIEEFSIKSVYNYSQNDGSFCACSNRSSFFVVTVKDDKFYLNLYSLINEKLSLKSSIPLQSQLSQRTDLKCVGNDTFIWAIFSLNTPYTLSLTSYKANLDGMIKEVNKIQKQLQKNYYSLQAVISDIFIVMYREYSPIFFYNKYLEQLNYKFQSPNKFLHLISIQSYRDNKILIRTDYSLQIWTFQENQLKYSGSYPTVYNNNGKQQSFNRNILLPKLNLLILDYGLTVNFQLDNPPQRRIGYGYNQSKASFNSLKAKFLKKSNQLFLIVSMSSSYLFKLKVTSSYVTKLQSTEIAISSVKKLRLSSDQQKVIILGSYNSYIIVSTDNLRYIQYYATMQYPLQSSYYLNDLDYISSTRQIVSVTKKFPQQANIATLVFLVTLQNIQKIGFDTSITSIQSLTFSRQIFVYSGIGLDNQNANFFVIQNYNEQIQAQKYDCNCTILLLAISPSQKKVAVVCSNQSVFVFTRDSQKLEVLQVEGNVIKISFLNENKIVININGILIILYLKENINNQKPIPKQINAALQNSSFAIDYSSNILAYQTFTSIRFLDILNEVIVDEIPLYGGSNLQIISLAFNSNGDTLYVSLISNRSTSSYYFNTYTSKPCPENRTLSEYFICVCKDTFIYSGSFCICPGNLVLINSSCGCRDRYVLYNNMCRCPSYFVQINNTSFCPGVIINDTYCQCPNNQIYDYQTNTCICEKSHLTINSSCICPNNLVEMDSGICSCTSPFVQKDNFCVCQEGKGLIGNTSCRYCSSRQQLKKNSCQCKSGYVRFQNPTTCDSCSFVCSECNSIGLFDCKDYNALFYFIISASSLFIVVISILIFKKCRTNKKKQDSQLTQSLQPSK